MADYGRDAAKDYAGYQPGLFSRDPRDPAYSETGVFGDPTKATAEKGRKALAILTAEWLKALRGFARRYFGPPDDGAAAAIEDAGGPPFPGRAARTSYFAGAGGRIAALLAIFQAPPFLTIVLR